jgi:hypothetical protein
MLLGAWWIVCRGDILSAVARGRVWGIGVTSVEKLTANYQVRPSPSRAEPLARGRAELLHNAEMTGFGFRFVVRVYAGQGHSFSASSINPWLSTTLPFCVIGTQMKERQMRCTGQLGIR